MTGSAPRVAPRDLLKLAFPAALSYVLHNAFRINDQFWIQGLGAPAQAAVGGVMFVAIMNFALSFLAIGGTLTLVAHATGAGDVPRRDAVVRLALKFGLLLSVLIGGVGFAFTEEIVGLLGLGRETADHAVGYLATLFVGMAPITMAPVVAHALIGAGDTRTPALMQVVAVAANFVLNPLFIYGAASPPDVALPGASLWQPTAEWLGLPGWGLAGAAAATSVSRLISVALGLFVLRSGLGVRLTTPRGLVRFDGALFRRLVEIGAPTSLSIAAYAGVYWVLIRMVLTRLGDAPLAALGIGFTVFEGLSYPCFLGLSIAAASLVGRSLGAGRPDLAWEAVRSARTTATVLGLAILVLFFVSAPVAATWFSPDPDVVRETTRYVFVIAVGQLFVAHEAVHEKILLGAGHTFWPMCAAILGNGLRIPLGILLAITLDWGPSGLWWTIGATSALKAALLFTMVQRRRWLGPAPAPAPAPS